MIKFYDTTQTLFSTNPLKLVFNGQICSIQEYKFHIKNDDPLVYYTDVDLNLSGTLPDNSWMVKFLYGGRRPTDREWASVRSGDTLRLPDIGEVGAADTTTYHPVWIRFYVPGGTPAQYVDSLGLEITAIESLA